MRPILLISICFFFVLPFLPAQSGCPGCSVNVPAGLPVDTLYLQPVPNGLVGEPYDEDISFRVPKSTTPVNAIDSTTPPGLPISKIEIVSVEGLPAGLFWEANQLVFETATETDGCIKICGKPLEQDSFVLTVKLKATVLIFTQEASFPMRMYIAPKTSATDGFTMTNYVGCGSAAVSFTNNIPSGGKPGFSYLWDFGDGDSSTLENPGTHTYTTPGVYTVNYHATIDTSGYTLLSATVLSVDGCTDQAGLGKPDLYLFILDPDGKEVFNSSPEINNTNLPHAFTPNLLLGQGSYRLEVWDEDSGLEGSDDPCGVVYFNALNDGDTLVSGNFRVVLNILHQVDEVFSSDTVIVYPQPVKPVIMANKLSACQGSSNIVLQSSYGAGNQWWLDGHPIPDATDFLYVPTVSGHYQVQANPVSTCLTISDSVKVEIYPLPAVPFFINDRNNLEMTDTLAIPVNFALQWYLFAAPIPGATGFTYCALQSGTYHLEITDLDTGCKNEFSLPVTFNPTYDCTVGAGEATLSSLNIYPNPASGEVTIQLEEPLSSEAVLRVWDVAGRLAQNIPVGAGADRLMLNAGDLNPGWYALELALESGKRIVGRLAVVR